MSQDAVGLSADERRRRRRRDEKIAARQRERKLQKQREWREARGEYPAPLISAAAERDDIATWEEEKKKAERVEDPDDGFVPLPIDWSLWSEMPCFLCGHAMEPGCPACDSAPATARHDVPQGAFAASTQPPQPPRPPRQFHTRAAIEEYRAENPICTCVVHHVLLGRRCSFALQVSDEPELLVYRCKLGMGHPWDANYCLVAPSEAGLFVIASFGRPAAIRRWGDIARSQRRPVVHLLLLPRASPSAISAQAVSLYKRNFFPPRGRSWSTDVHFNLVAVPPEFPEMDSVQVALERWAFQ